MELNFTKDELNVVVLNDRKALGEYAAAAVSNKIIQLSREKKEINIIFAAAPSQNEFLEALVADASIPWQQINAFHMDEYLGLPAGAPQSFGSFLKERIFDRVPFKSIHIINTQNGDYDSECLRYADLLHNNPPDIVCMGIGENTHIAFNDPPAARFDDPQTIRKVQLDLSCRQQQVNDKCFNELKDVPEYALTLTLPALMQASCIFCMVPGKLKAAAIMRTLSEPVGQRYPSTILRTHKAAWLFVDRDSYGLNDGRQTNILHN